MKKLMLILIVTLLLATPVFAKNDPKYINNKSVFIENEKIEIPIMERFPLHNTIITNKNKVYVWGYNNGGELGLGDTNNRLTPTENTNLENIIQQNGGISNIQRLYVGHVYNILIFKNGKVYVWGENSAGELGFGDSSNRITPLENHYLENIISQNGGAENLQGLYIGGKHNIMVFRNGNVYVWGYNRNGELGRWNTNNEYSPLKNNYLENTIQQNGGIKNIQGLYVGFNHNILIFKSGKVYVWGWNYYGQLGLGDTTNRKIPIENRYLENIISQNGGVVNLQGLYVGGYHNILILKNGKVYVWGYNKDGELGRRNTNNVYSPLENYYLENIIRQNGGVENIQGLYVGEYHNILIFRNGKVYVWGWNRYGQLGLGDTTNRDAPTENANLENIISQNGGVENIQGLYVGGAYNILIFKNGKVYVWGRNDYGQLGLGDTNNRLTPVENTNLEGVISSAGFPLSVGGGIVSKISVLL